MPFSVALLLGLIQGLTEFLPISSSAHLVLAQELLGYAPPGLMLEIVAHLATTLVIIIYFHRRFIAILKGLGHDPDTQRLVGMVALSFAITAIMGVVLERWIAAAYESPAIVGGELLLTGAALASVQRVNPSRGSGQAPSAELTLRPPVEERLRTGLKVEGTRQASTTEHSPLTGITWKAALFVGLAQGLSIFPGLSRSGLTIVAGLWCGLGRSAAAEFSFLLAVPTILAASLYELWREPDLSGADTGALLLVAAVSFISGLLAIHWLMRWISRGRMVWFAVYCGLVGVAALVFFGLDLL